MVGASPYRFRDVFTLGVGLTFLLSHAGLVVGRALGQPLFQWSPWAAAMLAGGLVGAIAREPGDGAGVGVFAAGFGGALFVFGNFADQGLVMAARNAVLALGLFAVVGAFTGGVAGFVRGRVDPPEDADGDAPDCAD
jgi:hypothetical protein